jgi:hypothetical protein
VNSKLKVGKDLDVENIWKSPRYCCITLYSIGLKSWKECRVIASTEKKYNKSDKVDILLKGYYKDYCRWNKLPACRAKGIVYISIIKEIIFNGANLRKTACKGWY